MMKLRTALQPVFVCSVVVGLVEPNLNALHAAAAQAAPPAVQTPGPAPSAIVVPPTAQVVPLWANGAPGSEARKGEAEQINGEQILNVHDPSITVMLPRKDIS